MNNPVGALAPDKSRGLVGVDIEGMYHVLIAHWSAVCDIFPDVWGADPRRSRLMHSAGFTAMGVLMDRIYGSLSGCSEDYKAARRALEKVAATCRWTKGTWESLGLAWNEIQNTRCDIRKLQSALLRAYTYAMN
ncbi:ParB N-terminal domain-containing protein [Paraburkholderia aspalathi]|uniref:hypothetical protein n=1 Tax=Paraburkholderia aspalathi TaxID=1324617 RepID=UPI00190B6518|nr:hypothetical protein [Paraburkholderia aspalathi]